MTASYGTFDDTVREELSSEVAKKIGAATVKKSGKTSTSRKIRNMPMK